VGLFVAAGVLIHSLMAGRRAPVNPWGAATLEWQALSPPIHHNFDGPLLLTNPYDYTANRWDESEQGFVTVDPAHKEAPST